MSISIDQLRQQFDRYQRQFADEPDSERITTEHVTRSLWHRHQMGMVLHSQLTPATADQAIAQEIAFFADLGYSFEWKHYSYDQPPDLPDRLLHHGFQAGEVEAVLVLPIAVAPEKLLAPITLDIRKATTREHFADVDQVHYAVWKDDPALDHVTPTMMTDWFLSRYQQYPDSLSMYVVYVDGQPISYGRVEFLPENPFASIWGGSTLPAYRKRGIYTQLVAQRLQEARARGCQYLTVDARQDTSMPILQKLGFIRIADATAYNWHATPT
ncbi:MAG: GNAT family N-acetyltransferase [Anaerolineae bacterium]